MKMLSEQIKRELQSQPPNHTQHKHYSTHTDTHTHKHTEVCMYTNRAQFTEVVCAGTLLLWVTANSLRPHSWFYDSFSQNKGRSIDIKKQIQEAINIFLFFKNVQIGSGCFFFFILFYSPLWTLQSAPTVVVELSESTSASVPLHKPSGLIFPSGVMIGWLRGRHLWIIH